MCFEQPDRLNAKVFINFGYDQLKFQTLVFQCFSNLHNWITYDLGYLCMFTFTARLLFLGRLSYRNVISSKYSQQGVTLQYCFMELSLVKVLRFNCPKISLLNQKGLHHFSCSIMSHLVQLENCQSENLLHATMLI